MGFKIGDKVRVKKDVVSMYSGEAGTITADGAKYYDWRVQFSDGTHLPLNSYELELVAPVFVPKFKKGDLVEVDYREDSDWNGKAVVKLAADYAGDVTIVEPLQGEYKGMGGGFSDSQLKPYVEPVTFKVGDLVEILPSAPGRIGEFARIFEVSPRYSWRVRFPNGVILAVFESEISH